MSRLNNWHLLRVLTLIALALTLPGCAQTSTRYVPTPQAVIPPLLTEARQEPLPPECSPTCSAALSIELNSWPALPTGPASPD